MTCELVRKGRQEPRILPGVTNVTWGHGQVSEQTPETGRAPGVRVPTQEPGSDRDQAVPDGRLKERTPDARLQSSEVT